MHYDELIDQVYFSLSLKNIMQIVGNAEKMNKNSETIQNNM